ncbi:uncharacterized protein LOC113402526 [Vanessa tameamea]|uniref:Uncharacterized protein LOC113402526 n=1 Tax=Vanessa tameamea TaxID=334116 RepID=A0ABM4AM66_VANTA
MDTQIPIALESFGYFNIIFIISIISMDFHRHLLLFSFYILLKILTIRLKILNKYLTDCINLQNENNTKVVIYNINKDIYYHNKGRATKNKKIIRLAEAYKIIGEGNNLINEIFEFQNSMIVVFTFSYIIITLWSSIYYYRTLKMLHSFIALPLQCIIEFITMGLMTYACDMMSSERNATKILVNELVMDYDLPKAMRIQAKAFMEIVELWPMKTSAYDMFPINIQLILKFVSVSTTYLIVIIQVSHFL